MSSIKDSHFKDATTAMNQCVELLRNEISVGDYYVLLYLLQLKRDSKSLRIDFTYSSLFTSQEDAPEKFHKRILPRSTDVEIGSLFMPIVQRLSARTLQQLSQVLLIIDANFFAEHYSEIFDYALYQISKSQGRIAGEVVQPAELTQFIQDLVQLPTGSKVYNPFAGFSSFGISLNNDTHYLGQEINRQTWAIGALRLMAYNKPKSFKLVIDDSTEHWNPNQESFDLIIANPPFGMRLGSELSNRFGKARTYESFLIQNGIEALKSDGKLIAVLSLNFLYAGGVEKLIRQNLMDLDLVDTVISFPGGLLANTPIPFVVLVLNKRKKMPGFVKFIDASDCIETLPNKEKRIRPDELKRIVLSEDEDKSVQIVPKEQIAENDYSLHAARYLHKEFEGIPLSSLLTPIKAKMSSTGEVTGRFIRIRDLNSDKFDYLLKAADAEVTSFSNRIGREIKESCLLLALRWRTLKPTYFKFDDEAIFVSNDIASFKVDESKVDIAYLMSELHADYVLEQLLRFNVGASIPLIRRDDLLNIKIKLPSLSEQKDKLASALSEKIRKEREERNKLAHGIQEQRFNEFASLKHSLGAPRQNILSYSEALLAFFQNNDNEAFQIVDQTFRNKYGQDLVSAFRSIKNDINFISELLEKGEDGLVLNDYALDIISMVDFEREINRLKLSSRNFRLKIFPLQLDKKASIGVLGNHTLFKVLFENILSNAQKHAFEAQSPQNEVVMDLKVLGESLIIDIKNNGKPFPKNFTKEKFIAKYSTADPGKGTGLGGYDINRIVEYLHGGWELLLNEDHVFPVRFQFSFPLKPVK